MIYPSFDTVIEETCLHYIGFRTKRDKFKAFLSRNRTHVDVRHKYMCELCHIVAFKISLINITNKKEMEKTSLVITTTVVY